MSGIAFVVYGLAAPGGSKTVGRTKAGGTFVRDASKRAAPWKKDVARTAAEAMDGEAPQHGPLELWFVFVLPRPKGHFGRKGNLLPSAPAFPTTRPDAGKLARPAADALTGICWIDDSQVVDEHHSKRYGHPPRLEVRIKPIADQPS